MLDTCGQCVFLRYDLSTGDRCFGMPPFMPSGQRPKVSPEDLACSLFRPLFTEPKLEAGWLGKSPETRFSKQAEEPKPSLWQKLRGWWRWRVLGACELCGAQTFRTVGLATDGKVYKIKTKYCEACLGQLGYRVCMNCKHSIMPGESCCWSPAPAWDLSAMKEDL